MYYLCSVKGEHEAPRHKIELKATTKRVNENGNEEDDRSFRADI